MKILKIFGVVVGVHVFALILIFANPGCSSAKRPMRDASETVIASGGDTTPLPHTAAAPMDSPITAAPPASFDPDAPAPAVRFSPTRPGTPTAAALEAAPVADVTPASTYTVVRGDSLWTIAKKHNSSVAEIAAANNLRTNAMVRVGQKLIIPAKPLAGNSTPVARTETARATPPPVVPRTSGDALKHVVQPGETLGAIARKYQSKVGDIAIANNIADPARIRPGMELTIPGWQAPASRTTRSTPAPRPASTEPALSTPVPPAATESVPTIVIPAPEEDLDAALRDKQGEPPVIQVEDQ